LHAVALHDLNLEDLVVCKEGGKSGETLATTTTNTKQKSVAERLSDHTLNARNVITGVQEHDQLHLVLD
jgi:hypothetical protein